MSNFVLEVFLCQFQRILMFLSLSTKEKENVSKGSGANGIILR